jgi:hypothetical protein
MTYSDYFPADTVDEQSDVTDMAGNGTTANQDAGRGSIFSGNPSMSLVALWFVTLAFYWAIGYFFKGQRS